MRCWRHSPRPEKITLDDCQAHCSWNPVRNVTVLGAVDINFIDARAKRYLGDSANRRSACAGFVESLSNHVIGAVQKDLTVHSIDSDAKDYFAHNYADGA